MATLHTLLRDAGPLAPKVEPTLAAPMSPQPVVVAPVAIESMPPLTIREMPARRPWRHTVLRDATGAIVEILSEPIEAAP